MKTGAAKRILLIEDDAALARVVTDNLAFEGYEVRCASDGPEAVDLARSFAPDLILLDLTLPTTDGFDLFGLLRQGGPIPIIVVSARGHKAEKLRGLDLGADDYVTKPFDLEELLARIHAVLRRTSPAPEVLVLGEVIVDFRSRTAVKAGEPLELTHREFDLLHFLANRRNRVVYRAELLREVWGYADQPFTRSVDHAIARLRKKIEPDPHNPRYIQTAHGDGYCLA